MKLTFSKSGLPCLWETGGGYTNSGQAQVICAADGSAKRTIYVRRRGTLACGSHALVPVEVGDYVIVADHHRKDYHITVSRIVELTDEDALLKQVYCFSMGEWDTEIPYSLVPAVDAAAEKAACYHCREPHFVKTE